MLTRRWSFCRTISLRTATPSCMYAATNSTSGCAAAKRFTRAGASRCNGS